MLKKLMDKIDGYKSYANAVLGAIIAVIGHFWGPIKMGPVDVPQVSSSAMLLLIWAAVALISGRHAIAKIGETGPELPK